ncbi:hypothetical protein PYW08_003003 [Mythimna loreyi]|uniref:Uncharacterized protein n=1 Tax=Mythimna loreyi TaxID=667449 RepID=A0ACC2QR13_9NEOP|nr:hypothetical protein PYW08_003003 [Mythimna loreyi]
MAENGLQLPAPTNSNFAADIAKNTTIVEEGPSICPLCSSVVRLYYVDFFTKIFMCTNMECEYPFGNNYTIYTSDDDGACQKYGVDLSRIPRRRYSKSAKSVPQGSIGTSTLGTNSNLSASEWAEINPPNQTYDSDDNMSMTSSKMFTRKNNQSLITKKAKKQDDEKLIKENVEKIKECNKVLFDGEDYETIQNEKWIKNLSTMQSSSGMKLVKDTELQKLKKTEDNICHGELKIDIDTKKDSMSSIVIEIDLKMQWLATRTCVLLAVFVYGGGGVTKTSGIEQFWTDDYKIFEQVYGKTSDRDIYGETLPPSIILGTDHKKQASQKNERYLLNLDEDSEEFETLTFGDRYKNLLNKQALKLFNKKKPATSTINFVSYSDFKPISQSNDPETYSYLKYLEEHNKEDKYGFPETVGGFKPYLNYLKPAINKPEETEAYKSIQEILEAHEANKENSDKNEEDNMKYLSYGKNKRKKPPRVYNDVSKPRCVSGRCRKRGAGPYRSRTRPRVRGLKTVFVV